MHTFVRKLIIIGLNTAFSVACGGDGADFAYIADLSEAEIKTMANEDGTYTLCHGSSDGDQESVTVDDVASVKEHAGDGHTDCYMGPCSEDSADDDDGGNGKGKGKNK